VVSQILEAAARPFSHILHFHLNMGRPIIECLLNTNVALKVHTQRYCKTILNIVKKRNSGKPIPSQDVTYQILPGREEFTQSQEGLVKTYPGIS